MINIGAMVAATTAARVAMNRQREEEEKEKNESPIDLLYPEEEKD